ncbi:hypothetical protein H8356DRAFT_933276 [Neocallimastix lanati (nom. inval.)]|uniref:MPN domain-containing protein n=1 Tax=Neocallimastix californiae TaxID=1754190 RepID=A0A1Y2FL14_9FUNG|nr:hypothetical protein H8356DRAFT_933276 [Neocallimastix sp. JGI-2020a]ORY84034.1 hypothetical protein LY90DRAFT_240671 [Neocallimastix californiae]|eukprot:ORY84034.1 hypothetical protein LY90DRAFT_240671 [Neocallimastix californiae]
MEIHSHLLKKEIMGLLGGRYDQIKKILYIKDIYPCRSEGTSYYCEMNVESEIEATNIFNTKNYNIVGWYHSHPIFEVNPSIVDIRNQYQHQKLAHLDSGEEPFIGMIISPYYNYQIKSNIKMFNVSEEWDKNHNYHLPYEHEFLIEYSNQITPEFISIVDNLLNLNKNDKSLINFNKKYKRGRKNYTYFNKLYNSAQSYLKTLPDTQSKMLLSIIEEHLK